jgi:hypothetical protein
VTHNRMRGCKLAMHQHIGSAGKLGYGDGMFYRGRKVCGIAV